MLFPVLKQPAVMKTIKDDEGCKYVLMIILFC